MAEEKKKPAGDDEQKTVIEASAAQETIVTSNYSLNQDTVINSHETGEQTVVRGDETNQQTLVGGDPTTQETVVTTNANATQQETVVLTAGHDPKTHAMQASGEHATERPPTRGGGSSMPHVEVKYEVVKRLGKGGFATVYLVKNIDLNRMEALKILATELSSDEDVTNRFVKEAQIAAGFNHQNIVTVYEVQRRGQWSSFRVDPKLREKHKEPLVYFSMSFVEGDTLTNIVRKKKRIPQKEALKYCLDAAIALEYAHGKGIVHRDIKPDNIMVDRKGNSIVTDFGIAKVVDQTRATQAGTFMGTARYVSPEQAMGKQIDGRSDIYSLGVTLYEIVTGRAPFDSDQWMTVLYQHINEPPPSPELFFEDIDRDLRAILLKMLAKKPDERFQSAQEVYDALGNVYRKLGGRDLATTPIDQIQTRADFMAPDGTAKTERPGAPPPVRSTKRPMAAPSQKKSKLPLFIGLGIAAAVIIGILAVLPKKPDTLTDDKNGKKPIAEVKDPIVAPAKMGSLTVWAFPKGQIYRIENANNEEVPIENKDLPLTLQLPEGSYKVIASYNGLTTNRDVFIIPNNINKLNLVFEVENDSFLLEDLR